MSASITFPAPGTCVELSSPVGQAVALIGCEKFPAKFVVHFSDIKFNSVTFTLRRPLELTLSQDNGGWTCEEATLSLFSFGATDVLAVCSLFEDFAVLWEEIAQASNDSLSEDAIQLKQRLLSLVQSVS